MKASAAKPGAERTAPLATTALHADLQRHLDHLRVERRLAERTIAMYREALVRLERFAVAADIALRDVQTMHVRRWAAQLHGQGLAPRSIAIALSAWRGLYRWWGRAGEVRLNPIDGVRAPKTGKPLPKALSVDQAVALAERRNAEADPALEARDRCIVELLYGCGLRIGELVGLDVAASDRAAGWIDATDGLAHVLGKGRKRRSVPVGAAALAALSEWITLRNDWPGPARAEQRALFVSRRGTRLTASQIRARLARRAVQAGVPSHVHPHMLRHSFASHILQSSGDLRGVQELLGHANITTTQVYTRLDFGHLSKVYDAAHPRAKRRGQPDSRAKRRE
jgi:integrase/recombinase XerC